MGMSTHVVGFTPPDEKYQKMKAVYDSCKAAGIEIPEDVQEFFDWNEPSEHGVTFDLDKIPGAVEEWDAGKDDAASGLEVDISKLPKNVKVVRFYNSW